MGEVEARKHTVEQTLKDCEQLIGEQSVEASSSTQPKYRVDHLDGGKQISVTVELPGLESVGDVELEVEGNELSLEAAGRELQLQLPPVDEDTVRARFVREDSTLIVTMDL